MYKMLSTMLVFLLVFCPFVYAEQQEIISGTVEDFSLRNGIKFLMTKDEVQSKEELPAKYQKYSVYDNNLQIIGTLAGIDDATGYYVFDSDSLLKSFEYSLGGSLVNRKTRSQVKSEYESIESVLTEKYGNPLSILCPITSDYLMDDINSLDDFGDNCDLISINERLIKNRSGGYVKIEHWSTYQTVDSDLEFVNHHVQYTYYPDEIVDSVIANLESKQIQKDNDL